MDPIRCTCGKLINQYFPKYRKLLSLKYTKRELLEAFNFKRDCCRNKLLNNINIIDKMLLFDRKKLITEALTKVDMTDNNKTKEQLYKEYIDRITVKKKRIYTCV